jgi:hypothetical protein
MEKETGFMVDAPLPVDEAVAQGAAVYARYLQDKDSGGAGFRVRNVNSHTLGVLGIEPSTMMKRRKVMIARNTPLPAEHTQRFMTAEADQKSVVVTVVEGGDDSGNHSTLIGRCVLAGLAANLPPRSQVDVTFHYAEDGCLSVRAFMPAVERESTLSIERAKGMSGEMLDAWAACIAAGMADDCTLPEAKQAEPGVATTVANPLHAPETKRAQRQVDVVAEVSSGSKEKEFVLGDEPGSSPTVMAVPDKPAAKTAAAARGESPQTKPTMKPDPAQKPDPAKKPDGKPPVTIGLPPEPGDESSSQSIGPVGPGGFNVDTARKKKKKKPADGSAPGPAAKPKKKPGWKFW